MHRTLHRQNHRLNAWESFCLTIDQRLNQGLLDEVTRASDLRPSWNLSKILALLFALTIHTLTLVLLYLGVMILIRYWPTFFGILFGLAFLLLAFVSVPHFPRLPGEIAPRQMFPTLYSLADRVAQALGITPVEGIVIDAQFNASFMRVGFRRKRILCLGLPLLSVLDSQEIVALTAHELAHDRNGDPARSLVTGSALYSLVRWHEALCPYNVVNRDLLHTLAMLFMLGGANMLRLGIWLFSHLVWRDSQRAEYLADAQAVEVGGAPAVQSLLGKMRLSELFEPLVGRAARDLWKTKNRDLFEELQSSLPQEPQRVSAAMTASDQRLEAKLDATHPPTGFRIKFVQSRLVRTPQVILSFAETECLETELAALKPSIQQRLIEQYQVWREYL
ncbi:MAG TPA: M48 family metalloprotease [Gallionella sp.]